MDDHRKAIAQTCLDGAKKNTMTFPQTVEALMQGGFDGYAIDFRRALATCYMPDGDSVELSMRKTEVPVAPSFGAARIQAAIEEAQQLAPGYTYLGFCRKAASAGCSGYVASFSGRRALDIDRTAETHVEHFPNWRKQPETRREQMEAQERA